MSITNISRRNLMKAATVGVGLASASVSGQAQLARGEATKRYKIKNKRIRQSIMGWTFNPMPTEELISACVEIGLTGIEGINRKFYPAAKKAGLEISLVGSHGFSEGPNNTKNHKMVIEKIINGIDVAKEVGAKRVITFVGMEDPKIAPDQAKANCVKAWKQVVGYAEKNGVKVLGESNILNNLPTSASTLYAKNLHNFVLNLYDKKNNNININLEDEIIKNTIVK